MRETTPAGALKFLPARPPRPWTRPGLSLSLVTLLLCGCTAPTRKAAAPGRAFNFQTDTFAFANELVWEYHYDEHGKWTSSPRQPKPVYTHHCFVVARSARQFFDYARFDPTQPAPDDATCRRLIRQVVSRKPEGGPADRDARIVIPGYADLREFSMAHGSLLKTECGGAWQSYVQHGHWRIMLPFSRRHQQRMSVQLLADLKEQRPPVVHLIRFPHLTINHALVLFDVTETSGEIRFAGYDPNNPEAPVTLIYDRSSRTFQFPANDYFPGGRVDVYEVYRDWRY